MYNFLDNINNPNDLKNLNIEDLPELCSEIRNFLIEKVSKTGGHLAPNLGIVELTVALHYIFNSPDDKFIFDVGHQCYVHKILTGRKKEFDSLRKFNGLSGFPKTYESEHDTFNTGHSSTSISSALGIATANKLDGNPSYTIAIIGDGALTGGLAFEGLNNANVKDTNLIVILNDNQMSISPSVGGLSLYLNKIRSNSLYTSSKISLKRILPKIPFLGKPIYKLISWFKKGFKHVILPSSIMFEQFGFSYLGPINGNDINELTEFLERAKNVNKPVLIHTITKKGKGYSFAEKNPGKFHGIGPFDVETGKPLKDSSTSFSSEFGRIMVEEASKNDKLVAITAAMRDGVGLDEFSKKYRDRFFDVGIAEEHAVTFASGLAIKGYVPVFAVYSTFLQRSYDQIIHDVALQNAHVIFAIDRGGIVGADGETHHGLFDLAFLSHIPNLTLIAPKDGNEFEDMMKFAFKHNGPIAIRYPRGSYEKCLLENKKRTAIEYGKAEILQEGKDITIIAYGKTVSKALEIANILKKKRIFAEVINVRFLKPIDKETICNSIFKTKKVVTIEDAYLEGGLASKVQELILTQKNIKSLFFGYPNEFIKHGSNEELEKLYKLDKISISKKIFKLFDKEKKYIKK
ncbi:MAG: 1-deoxy-D-xylulose-5-phosphate synthase [Clostridia bacterium]|nr:1-deoxy-D-xylulose-5-phosphate synthase [Clostridia bacterium]